MLWDISCLSHVQYNGKRFETGSGRHKVLGTRKQYSLPTPYCSHHPLPLPLLHIEPDTKGTRCSSGCSQGPYGITYLFLHYILTECTLSLR